MSGRKVELGGDNLGHLMLFLYYSNASGLLQSDRILLKASAH